MSVTTRSDGAGGEIHSFCAMNSLSMSFWIVPPTRSHGTPLRSAITRYIASRTDAEQFTVIEVVTLSSGMPIEQRHHVVRWCVTATPSRPTSPSARSWSAS